MDSQIHERDIVLRRLRPADVFEDIEAERFAQVIVVPVPPERERDMKNTFLHQHLRTFQQVEGEGVALATENRVHTRQVRREEAPEIGNIHDLPVHDRIVYVLGIEPRHEFSGHRSCTFLSLYSIGVSRR